jgi:hypothetical protein
VTEQLDVDLNDAVLTAEILLMADLMVAGSASAGPLSQADIDRLLITSTHGPAQTREPSSLRPTWIRAGRAGG